MNAHIYVPRVNFYQTKIQNKEKRSRHMACGAKLAASGFNPAHLTSNYVESGP